MIPVRRGLGDLESAIGSRDFLRCHWSYLVNIHYVEGVEGQNLRMKDQTLVPISATNTANIRRKIIDWIYMKSVVTSMIAFVLAAAVSLLLLLLWGFRLRKTLRREREENCWLRKLLRIGFRTDHADLAQLRKLRHDLRQYLILAGESGNAGESRRLAGCAGCRTICQRAGERGLSPLWNGTIWSARKSWGFRRICKLRCPKHGKMPSPISA